MNRVIEYALCYLNSNWDDWIEDDLGISYEKYVNLLKKFQKENIHAILKRNLIDIDVPKL